MNIETFLQKAGKDILKGITVGVGVAKDAAPFISIVDPALGNLINATAGAIISAEAAGTPNVANAPVGHNGAQKAALAISSIEPLAVAFAKSQGISSPTQAQLQQWVNGFVMAFNAFVMPGTKANPTAFNASVGTGNTTQAGTAARS